MSTKNRNWWIGLAAIVTVALIAAIWLATPAAGVAPQQAGSVLRVTVGQGRASGVHIGNGYVLTAAHVVAASVKASKDKPVPVTTRDDQGNEADAEVLWSSEKYDLALVKIAAAPEAAEMVCRQLVIGEPVMAYGNPSTLRFARSWGRVSTTEQAIGRWPRAVAIDAAVMPGSSGGPLFDEAGFLIGIVVGAANPAAGYAGFSFIVPALAICELLAR